MLWEINGLWEELLLFPSILGYSAPAISKVLEEKLLLPKMGDFSQHMLRDSSGQLVTLLGTVWIVSI